MPPLMTAPKEASFLSNVDAVGVLRDESEGKGVKAFVHCREQRHVDALALLRRHHIQPQSNAVHGSLREDRHSPVGRQAY